MAELNVKMCYKTNNPIWHDSLDFYFEIPVTEIYVNELFERKKI